MRTRYQYGTICRRERVRGPAVWIYRYFDETGKRKAVMIGTVQQYPTQKAALRAAEIWQREANTDRLPATMHTLAAQYERDELPELRSSTRSRYRPWINGYILPRWGDTELSVLARSPYALEQWLKTLALAPKSKAHIRSLLHLMFDAAMRWGLVDVQQNPLRLVRVKGASHRSREPRVLTPEECRQLLPLIPDPFRTMVIVGMCLGLRVSEILGLKWGDFDWQNGQVRIERAYVYGVESDVKTPYSRRSMPLDKVLAERLLAYRKQYAPEAEAGDWVFQNPDTRRPYRPHHVQEYHIQRAADKVLGGERIGWHAFRHTYSSLLRRLGVDVKVQQELLRHSDITTTLNLYTQAVTKQVRKANRQVVRLLLQ